MTTTSDRPAEDATTEAAVAATAETSAEVPAELAAQTPTQLQKVAPSPEAIRRKALLRFAISISVLTIVGHTLLGFEQAPIVPLIAVPTAYATNLLLETVDAWALRRPPGYRGDWRTLVYFLLPAHIAALACSMLIYADNIKPYLFATIAAIASKYVIRIPYKGRTRHFLNPSNAGIALTLLLMPLVGFTPPYMFLNNTDAPLDVLIPLGVLMAGTMLNAKLTHKLPLIMAWVLGYVVQALLRTAFFGDNLLATLQMTTGVAFVLYTNYMISDPSTSPVTRRGQIVFGASIALVYGVLIVAGVSYAIFFALTSVCMGRGAVLIWESVRFRMDSRRGMYLAR